ncbi:MULTISPECIES: GreA/GreB family elongation factor [Pseudoalteromonas]|uniref:Transcription elongation factor GreAB n=1 Tax=Pseudoalteromonas amylolytica TaxID=1859457 RepID=A0A1S1MQT9_9GAMM|nr:MULTISPECIES: GreA/GreB family elongation factor [Pseudoalteromonas]OHU86955.1 transcription elongation factor GreAB [Pseudoalteromonas sp. JW3]OHU88336.1 transcription elongation factor GreAB [Pseudoalteromonas amylolytica]
MNKAHVIEHIRFALEAKLSEATNAADSARLDATHEQSAAETQYDSLSIESGYLAQGQSERVNDAHKSIAQFEQSYDLQSANQVTVGSLIKAIDLDDKTHWFYFGPSEGGLKVTVKQQAVLVITQSAPIGRALFNKMIGDECEYQVASQTYSFEILDIL